MIKQDVWLKKSKKSGKYCQLSFLDSNDEWQVYFCPRIEVEKFLNGVFDMAKFKHINSIQNKGVKK